jgi:endonuclease YncB( thermonuclease family)
MVWAAWAAGVAWGQPPALDARSPEAWRQAWRNQSAQGGALEAAPEREEGIAKALDERWRGRVKSVVDGDTLTLVLESGAEKRIRLEGIDAPESTQARGPEARAALEKLVANKAVTARVFGLDKYGRALAWLRAGGVDVNARLLGEGWAWHYKKYNQEARFAKLEDAARTARRGLWRDSQPLPPWEYRRGRAAPPGTGGGFSGGGPTSPPAALTHWLNTDSGVRHNSSCRYYRATREGRPCAGNVGRACGICGG